MPTELGIDYIPCGLIAPVAHYVAVGTKSLVFAKVFSGKEPKRIMTKSRQSHRLIFALFILRAHAFCSNNGSITQSRDAAPAKRKVPRTKISQGG
ncbi:hypothetical protein VTN96DRAFT_3242 [Rasamsonia emersonii]